MAHHPCTDTDIIYTRKKITVHSSQLPSQKGPVLVTSCFHLQQDFAFLFSFSNAISSQPDSCHASACFCCFHYWVSGEDYGSCDQSLVFASTAAVTQAKVNQAFWEITLYLQGFLSIDITAYTNPSLPFCEFFNLLWQSQILALLFPKLHQLSPHQSFCLDLLLFAPSLVAFYLDLRTGKWLMINQEKRVRRICSWKYRLGKGYIVSGIPHHCAQIRSSWIWQVLWTAWHSKVLLWLILKAAELCSSGNGEEGEPRSRER